LSRSFCGKKAVDETQLTECRHPTTLRAMARKLLREGPLLATVLLGLATASCTSANVIGVVENEPICVDFALGPDTMMKGSLKMPVRVTILEGDDIEWERVVLGKRTATGKASKFVVPNEDEKYTVRWAQCLNTFAPRRVEAGDSRTQDLGMSYDCGEAKAYNEHELSIKQDDQASRVLAWVAPPEAGCWTSTTAEPASSASASASAEAEPPDAGADAAPDASGSGSASASAAAAPTSKPSAKPAAAPTPTPKAPPPAPKAPAPRPPAPKVPAPAPTAPSPPQMAPSSGI